MADSPSADSNNNRFAPITEKDHSGILWIASLLSGVYSVLTIFARVYIKKAYFGLDDWICVAATVISIASFTSVYIGLSRGLGKSSELLTATQLRGIGQAVSASQLSLLLSLCLSKCAIVLLIRRLFSPDMIIHRHACHVFLVLVTLWTVGSLSGLSTNCDPSTLMADSNQCSGQYLRWEIIGIFDAISEVGMVLLSFALVWQLRMRTQLKIRVILAFLFRLLLIPMIVGHIYFLKTREGNGVDRAISMTPVIVLEQIQLGYSLISATIPNLKSFIMSFDTAMMMDISHKLTTTETAPDSAPPTASSPILSETLSKASSASRRFTSQSKPEDTDHAAIIASLDALTYDGERTSTREPNREPRIIRGQFQWMIEQSRG